MLKPLEASTVPAPVEMSRKIIAPTAAGSFSAVFAFMLWGTLPIYWKLLSHVTAIEVLSHRVVWSFFWLIPLVIWQRRYNARLAWTEVVPRRISGHIFLSSLLIGVNWLLYIWAIQENRIIEASLGYFLTPLISVFLGMIFFGESLSRFQKIAIGVAVLGVALKTWAQGGVPWIALTLAGTFSIYGLLRKRSTCDSHTELWLETFLMGVPTAIYLMTLSSRGGGALFHADLATQSLLIGGGLVTALPLIFFGFAAKRIPLSSIGFIQFLAPSINFILGAFVYDEPFDSIDLVAFGLIWAAISIFVMDVLRRSGEKV